MACAGVNKGNEHMNVNIENELLIKVAEGDEKAFSKLLKEVVPVLQSIIFKVVKNEDAVLEILQESFVRIWLNRHKLPGLEKPVPWLKRLVLNETFTWLNKNARQANIFTEISQVEDPSHNNIIDQLAYSETDQVLKRAIEDLPPQRKLIFKMSREEGLKSNEIAEKLNLSNGYVKNALTAALKQLEDQLKKARNWMLNIIP
ncbi:hypothetical protein COR50_17845 [Chitinophaga caeni]|uniref:RNA polymerase sigma factor n=2 Tax=Chitinophaga caeni TaxID=2029983 RepID=A0A291QY68_9BACT|nr:hypothetical protein COR50_17845 [Chitinophaga caeni]